MLRNIAKRAVIISTAEPAAGLSGDYNVSDSKSLFNLNPPHSSLQSQALMAKETVSVNAPNAQSRVTMCRSK